MGHAICYDSFDFKTDKKVISSNIQSWASEEGDAGGLYEPISWYDNTNFATREEAEGWIKNHDHSYANIAVTYMQHEQPAKEKLTKYNELSDKAYKISRELDTLKATNRFANHKASFITCPQCGSKLNLKKYNEHKWYGKTNHCPICQESMLKATDLKKLQALEDKKTAAYDKAKAEYRKQEEKTKLSKMWLVKYEYHV